MFWRIVSISVVGLALLGGVFFWRQQKHEPKIVNSPSPQASLVLSSSLEPSPAASVSPSPTTNPTPVLKEPVPEFKQRITKKPFGLYSTPKDSPIQPERFTGYHTGVDVEFTDRDDDIAVLAIADGTVLAAQRVSGYGGAVIVRHVVDGQDRAVVYGHLDPGRLPKVGQVVKRADTLAYLGQGYTSQTDGERKHLHFAILKKVSVNWKGYVANEADLANWLNPVDYF